MSERVKYDLKKEIDLAVLELDKIENVSIGLIQVIARNHSPSSWKQVMSSLSQIDDQGEYVNSFFGYEYAQPGRLLVDVNCATVTDWIFRELLSYYQVKQQQQRMEALKPQLEIAAANSFEEPPVDELATRRKRKA